MWEYKTLANREHEPYMYRLSQPNRTPHLVIPPHPNLLYILCSRKEWPCSALRTLTANVIISWVNPCHLRSARPQKRGSVWPIQWLRAGLPGLDPKASVDSHLRSRVRVWSLARGLRVSPLAGPAGLISGNQVNSIYVAPLLRAISYPDRRRWGIAGHLWQSTK